MTVHMPNALFRSINHLSHSLYLFMVLSFSGKENRIIFHEVDFDQGDHKELTTVFLDENDSIELFVLDVRHTDILLNSGISFAHSSSHSPIYPIDRCDTVSILFQLLQKVNEKITHADRRLLVIEFNGISKMLFQLDQIDPAVSDIHHLKIKTVIMDLVAKASMANLKIVFNESKEKFHDVISTHSMQYAFNAQDIVL